MAVPEDVVTIEHLPDRHHTVLHAPGLAPVTTFLSQGNMEGTSLDYKVYTAPEGQSASKDLEAELRAIMALEGWWDHYPPWAWPGRLLVSHSGLGVRGSYGQGRPSLDNLTERILRIITRSRLGGPASAPEVTHERVLAAEPQMVIGSMPRNPWFRLFAVNQTFVGGHCGPGNSGLFFTDSSLQGDPEITEIAGCLLAIPGINKRYFGIGPDGIGVQTVNPGQWTDTEPLVQQLVLSHLGWSADVPVHRIQLPSVDLDRLYVE